MKIGIDLSPLQTGHKKRGVGSVIINVIGGLSDKDKASHVLIFFFYPDKDSPLELLDLKDINYEVRYLKKAYRTKFAGKLQRLNMIINPFIQLVELHTGDGRMVSSDMNGIESFLQFEQNTALPRKAKKHTTLVLYDMIPYVLESDYLWSYRTSRHNGLSRKSSLKHGYNRKKYIYILKTNVNRAKKLIAISQHTKDDFVRYVNAKKDKIDVVYLGNGPTKTNKKDESSNIFTEYHYGSWGTTTNRTDLSKKPFLLYIGGADPRRRLVDLTAAYFNLKARGYEISLVLAGDTMSHASNTPNESLRRYLNDNSSYCEDLHFVGFISEAQKLWLYSNALTYIYPSVYEGFGLPVLESMANKTPVITYNNSSIYEIAEDNVIYAKDFLDIVDIVASMLNGKDLSSLIDSAYSHSQRFTWSDTSSKIIALCTDN